MPCVFIFFVLILLQSLVSTLTAGVPADPDSAIYLETKKQRAIAEELWSNPYWLSLLHYDKSTFSGYVSKVEDERFFLSTEGRFNPKSELLTALKEFLTPLNGSDPDYHPQCRFRARFDWLRIQLQMAASQMPSIQCEAYTIWITEIDPESLTLVFPNYNFTSLESSFGHLFIRINSQQRAPNHVLDYTVNYAAFVDPAKENKIEYVVKGIFGGYPGKFSVIPYHLKIKEYANLEARDLWEYDLNFSKQETIHFLNHLWELQQVETPYYFFKENCSSQMLNLLEIARPGLDLGNADVLWNIPSDTLKTVSDADLIDKRSYRPSQKSRIYQKLALLTDNEKKVFYQILENAEIIQTRTWNELDVASKSTLLEMYIEYLGFNRIDLTLERQYSFLKKRAELDYVSNDKNLRQLSTPPEEGHRSSNLKLAVGRHSALGDFAEIGIKPAYHGFMDNDQGFFPNGEIDILNLKVRVYENNQVIMEELTLLSLQSLIPFDRMSKSCSWKFKLGIENAKNDGCPTCSVSSVRFGYGVSLQAGEVLLTLLPEAFYSNSEVFEENYQAGLGLDTGFTYVYRNHSKVHVSHFFGRTQTEENISKSQVRFRRSLGTNIDIRLKYTRWNKTYEGAIGFSWFF